MGFFSIIKSINGNYYVAASAIFFAGLFDMLDGRVARMMKTQSEFGAQYDSLVDLASFGLAPAILIYTWSLKGFHQAGWFLAFMYFACAALRLARFNVQTTVVDKKKFCGLPTPPAACVLASYVVFSIKYLKGFPYQEEVALVLVPLLAVLMVSSVSYRSFKEFDVKKKNSFYVLLAACASIGIIAIQPEIVLFAGFTLYALLGPLLIVLFTKRPARVAASKSKSSPKQLAIVKHFRKAGLGSGGDTVLPLKPPSVKSGE